MDASAAIRVRMQEAAAKLEAKQRNEALLAAGRDLAEAVRAHEKDRDDFDNDGDTTLGDVVRSHEAMTDALAAWDAAAKQGE